MKNVLVTGGARGIGDCIAKTFTCHDTYRVFVVDKSFAKSYVDNKIIKYKLDVTNSDEIHNVLEEINSSFDGIDILVNNAGISPKQNGIAKCIEELDLEEWNSVISTNLTSAFLFAKYTLPNMKRKNWGRIINISSQSARTAAKIAGPHYATSKTGMVGLSRQIASKYGEFNITSNCIAPGRIESEMTLGVSHHNNEKFLEHVPIKRMGKGSEVASLVKYLASDEAGYITGTTIDINGGAFIG